MVRKDLQLLFSDRRAVIMSFVVPIAIASFFGVDHRRTRNAGEPAKIPIAIVDQDGSTISKAIVSARSGRQDASGHGTRRPRRRVNR